MPPFKDQGRGELEATVRDNVTRDMRISVPDRVTEDHDLIGTGRGRALGPHSVPGMPTFDGNPRRALAPGSLGVDMRSPLGAGTDGTCRMRAPGGGPALVDAGAHEVGGVAGTCPWAPGGSAP